MRQKTTTISAEELFGKFSDLSEFQNMEDGFEKYWFKKSLQLPSLEDYPPIMFNWGDPLTTVFRPSIFSIIHPRYL